jgi:hypothetical protein
MMPYNYANDFWSSVRDAAKSTPELPEPTIPQEPPAPSSHITGTMPCPPAKSMLNPPVREPGSDEQQRRRAELRERAEASEADMEAATTLAREAALQAWQSGARPGLDPAIAEWRQATRGRVVVGQDFGEPEVVPLAREVPHEVIADAGLPRKVGTTRIAGYTAGYSPQ